MDTAGGFALNHITTPRLRFAELVALVAQLSIRAVEVRNDLVGVEIADGSTASGLRRAAEAAEVRILSINALQRFNDWSSAREAEAVALAGYARECGAEALVLCPVNSVEDRRAEAQRADDLRRSLERLMPILRDHGIRGLVEPLGFAESSLRLKRLAIEAIDEVGGLGVLEVVHDTFHHFLAGEQELFAGRTGLVHVSGVESMGLERRTMRDEHRVLVGQRDRLGNVGQIRALRAAGYRGPLSFEAFAPSVHSLDRPAEALRDSIAFISREAGAAA